MQTSMFINGLKYVIPCQNRLSSKSMGTITSEQYQNLCAIVKNCLKDHRMSITDERAKQAFQALGRLFDDYQQKKLSRKLQLQAQHEHRIVRSIQCLIRSQKDIIIRRTDKSKVFYIGKASDFAHKTEEYMLKTQAYQEIPSDHCPLADNLKAVQTLLEYLRTKNALTEKQCKQLSPKLNQLELGHYHALPKPHKVIILFHLIYST